MKRLITILLMLFAVTACAMEAPVPDEQAIAERAIPLFEILVSCPSVSSFEEAPEADFANEAVKAYLKTASPSEITDEAAAYAMLFASGAFEKAEAQEAYPARVQLESALDSGSGTVKASVRAEIDYGYGFEFAFYTDIYLLPDEEAPFGARVARVFFPE